MILGCFASAPLCGRVSLCDGCTVFQACLSSAYENVLKLRLEVAMENEVLRLQKLCVRNGIALRASPADVGRNYPLNDAQERRLEEKSYPLGVREVLRALWCRGLDADIMRAHLREGIHPMQDLRNLTKVLETVDCVLTELMIKGFLHWTVESSKKPAHIRTRAAKIALIVLRIVKPNESKKRLILNV